MDVDKQFLVKLDFRSYSCRVWDCGDIPCDHELTVIQRLHVNTYSYMSVYYYSATLSSTYKGCVQPVGIHSD